MGRSHDPAPEDPPPGSGRNIIMHPLYLPKLPPWFDLRVFYIRIANCDAADASTPRRLTVAHVPLSPDTVLEVNGRRSSIYSDCVSSVLGRDRVDASADEATFVGTDSVRMTGSVRFEVFDRDALLLTGVLELCDGGKRWGMKCRAVASASVFLKGRQLASPEMRLPVIEVYVAGSFAGRPIILTETLQLSLRKKSQKKLLLDSIPEYDPTEVRKVVSSEDGPQIEVGCIYNIAFPRDAIVLSSYEPELSDDQAPKMSAIMVQMDLLVHDYEYKTENDVEIDYNSIYSRVEYTEGEDGELSWFNAGVRVGVGIGLGICLGVGIGVGVLVRTYQSTTRNFKRRLI